jgi:hypothetical protein
MSIHQMTLKLQTQNVEKMSLESEVLWWEEEEVM